MRKRQDELIWLLITILFTIIGLFVVLQMAQ